MTLADYLRTHKLSHAKFAARIGTSQPTVTRYANGQRIPNLKRIFFIEQETSGLVRPIDFLQVSEARASDPRIAA